MFFRLWDWSFGYGADSRWHEWRLARRSRGQDTMQGAASPLTHWGLDLFPYTWPRIYHCAEGSTWCPTHVQRQHATWNSKLRTSRWNFTASGIRLGGGKPDSIWACGLVKKNRLSDVVNRTREIYTICEHVIMSHDRT